jgi:hypothetical protein
MIMIGVTRVSEAIPRMPVITASKAVALLKIPFHMTRPMIRMANERMTMA